MVGATKISQMAGATKISQLYMTSYAQQFSPCGRFLAVGNNYGEISVFRLRDVFGHPSKRSSAFKLSADDDEDPVFSLTNAGAFLCAGGVGRIDGWSWEDCVAEEVGVVEQRRPAWSLTAPIDKAVGGRPEINALVARGSELFAAAGDGTVYCWSIETGALLRKFLGHSDYVHCLAIKDDHTVISGSEDGTLRFWDSRKDGGSVFLIEPNEHSSCARPSVGKWISCLDVEEDRVICGGGPCLSLFHLKMSSAFNGLSKHSAMKPLVVFDPPGPPLAQNVVRFCEEGLVSAGSSPHVNHWDLSGHLSLRMPVTPSSVYSVEWNRRDSEFPVTAVAGSSDRVDLCVSRGYSSFSLNL